MIQIQTIKANPSTTFQTFTRSLHWTALVSRSPSIYSPWAQRTWTSQPSGVVINPFFVMSVFVVKYPSFALVKDLSSILDISAELDQDLQTRQYIMDLGAVPILGRPIRDTLIC